MDEALKSFKLPACRLMGKPPQLGNLAELHTEPFIRPLNSLLEVVTEKDEASLKFGYGVMTEPLHQSSDCRTRATPGFIEYFGFHLALHLLGGKIVSEAIQRHDSSESFTLSWRSPLRTLDNCTNKSAHTFQSNASEVEVASSVDESDTQSHFFFIDATFEFMLCNDQRSLQTKFGALLKPPQKANGSSMHDTSIISSNGAVYLQSQPWTLSDLETYAIGTGICVEETGPAGMAETVALSLKKIIEPRLKRFQLTKSVTGQHNDSARINAHVDIFHMELLERVTLIHSTQSLTECYVGSVALPMLTKSLFEFDTRKEHDLESSSISLTQKDHGGLLDAFKEWWALPSLKSVENECKCRLDGENSAIKNSVNLGLDGVNSVRDDFNPLLIQGQDEISIDIARVRSSKGKRKGGDIVTLDDSCDSVITKPNSVAMADDSSNLASKNDHNNSAPSIQPARRRPKIVHGATRTKRRKKGKLTFAKA